MSNNNLYNILANFNKLTPAEKPVETTPKEKIYESVEARGSVAEGLSKIEARLAETFAKEGMATRDSQGPEAVAYQAGYQDGKRHTGGAVVPKGFGAHTDQYVRGFNDAKNLPAEGVAEGEESWHGIKDPELLQDLIADAQAMDYDEFYDEYSSMLDDPEEFWSEYHVAKSKKRSNKDLTTGISSADYAAKYPDSPGLKFMNRTDLEEAVGLGKQGVAEGEGGLGQVAGIGINGKQFNFSIKDLIAKAQNYPIKKLNPQLFVKQLADRHEDPKQTAARAQAADLQYPIIVVQDGNTLMIADGTHRAQKAIMNKLPSINAYVIPVEDMAEFSKQGVAEGEGIDPKIQFLQPTIQFAEKMGYRVTLNPQGRVVAKLVNKQLGHIVHIGKFQPSGKGFEVSMADNLDWQTNAWSAKELAQDFKGWYARAVKDQDFNNGYNERPQLEQQGVAEAPTDYSKRRQRERDIDAGKPVAKQRQSKMTDYQKRRAEQKRQEELGEDGEGTPEGLPHLTRELLSHIVDQVGTEGAHAIVKSLEWGDGAAEELLVLILKDLKQDIGQEEIDETIRKVKGGYRLVSHTGKNLGTYPTKGGAEKRERQVQYFKHANESTNYWTKLQQDRDQRQHAKAYSLLESLQDVIKDIK